MKIIFDLREGNNKAVFECKSERDAVFTEKCPSNFGLQNSECTFDLEDDACTRCWNAAVKCEVVEPRVMAVLEVMPDSCDECPCFNEEYGLCGITKEWYDDYTKKKLDSCPIIIN